MTSAQTMPPAAAGARSRGAMVRLLMLVAVVCASNGCFLSSRLGEPTTNHTPYDGPRLIGVAPIVNESGASSVDQLAVTDAMQRKAEEVSGFTAVSVNRVVHAMRDLQLTEVTTPGEARLIMQALDLDALITGVITAWDEYRPFKLGIVCDLYVRDAPRGGGLDPYELSVATGMPASMGEIGPAGPSASTSRLFDASNHQTLKWVREYADSRTEPSSAYRDDVYLVSMDLYTEFACHRLLGELLESERLRLQPPADASSGRR